MRTVPTRFRSHRVPSATDETAFAGGHDKPDLRVLKFIRVPPHGRLDLVVEMFNVLNRTNVTVVNPVFGSGVRPSSGFGQPIEAAAPRQLQLSVDLEF